MTTEGLASELESRVQRLRKDAGYEVTTRIALAVDGDAPLVAALTTWRDWIAGETLALDIRAGATLADADRIESVTIDGHVAALAVRRREERRNASGPDQVDGS